MTAGATPLDDTEQGEPREALDLILILRLLRDESGRVVDAAIEYVNDTWRAVFGSMDRDPSGESLVASFPSFADRLPLYATAVETGKSIRRVNPMPGDMSRRFAVQFAPDGERVIVVSHEVTREEALEKAQRESEERFRLAMESSAIGMCLVSPDGTFLTVNPALCAMLGRPADVLTACTWQELTHPDDLAIDLGHVRDVLDGRLDSYRLLKRFLRPDGAVVWGDLAVAGVRGDDRSVRYFVSQIVDVTAGHDAEEALRASEARYRVIADSATDAVVTARDDGTIVAWNPAATGLFGYTAQEAIGRPVSLLVSEALVDDHEAGLDRFRDTADRHIVGRTVEVLARRRDGSQVPVEMSLAEWVDAGGHFATAIIRDITDRKQAEDELRAREAELAEAQRISHVGSWTWDPDGDVVGWSDELFRIFGFGPAATAPSFAEQQAMYTPETRQGLVDAVAHALESGEPYETAVDVRRPDGEVHHLIARGEAIRGPEGTVVRLRGTLSDVTEMRDAEEAFRRLAAAVDETDESIVVTDLEANILYVNPAFERVTGYPRAAAIGQNPRILQSGYHEKAFYDAMWAALAAGETWRGELRNRRRDGSMYTEDATITPVHGRDGRVVNFVAVTRDVTEQRAARDALLAREAELAEAQRIAHVGSWTLDPATGAYTWSDELYRVFGREPGGRIPSLGAFASLDDEATLAERNVVVARTLETGEPWEVEHDITLLDGSARRVVARGEAVRDSGGAILGLRGTITDVTELREAQGRLDQARRAEMVGRLAGGVAHDFNNLLVVINGNADFLAASLPPDDPRLEDVAAISEAGIRAAALTRQLLALGRRQTLRPVVIDVSDAIAWLTPMLRSLLDADVEIVIRRDPASAHVRVDHAQLEQVVMNLVLNARDAMPAGGRLTIETACLDIEAGDPRLRPPAEPGRFVRITVADTGAGVGPEDRAHIFEPFYTTKEFGSGSGLGLATVDGVVAQSGGFVTVDSEVGAGSTFSIFLPRSLDDAVETPRQAPVRAAAPGTADGHGTILLVEDEHGVRAVTARTLRDLGYAVIDARDPAAALAIAEAGPGSFDMLLTDLVMPGMNGRELAERLTAMRPGLPVLYMSGYAPEKIFGEGLLSAGTPFLAKPFGRDELAARVRGLAHRPTAADM